MPDEQFPLLFFPAPQRVTPPKPRKGMAGGNPDGFHGPDHGRQVQRLEPAFTELERVLANESIEVSSSPAYVVPEDVLVLKTKGSMLEFQKAIRNIPGMEWLAEYDLEDAGSDEDFFFDGHPEKSISQHFVFSFTNHTAMRELLGLWKSWKDQKKLPFGKGAWEGIFAHLDEIRPWSIVDRLREYGMLEAWERSLNESDPANHPFEVEFWYRRDEGMRRKQVALLRQELEAAGGQLVGIPAWIEEAEFHAVKAELPVSFLRDWLHRYTSAPETEPGPFGSHEIRCIRPSGCSVVDLSEATDTAAEASDAQGDPLVAVLDGYPMSQHTLLRERIVVHDLDEFADSYQAHQMRHGTAMCSLVSLGQLDAPTPLRRKILCRPILKPIFIAPTACIETVPDELFPEELVWRAIHELLASDHPGGAVAPSVRIINLSVGDGQKPYLNRLSSWARVLDILAWKFRILFIVATGNAEEIPITDKPSDFRNLTEEERRRTTLRSLHESTRSRTLLSPSEAMNVLTIGAAHIDASPLASQPYGQEDLLPGNTLISPISRHGAGPLRSLKPELVFPGGRQFYQDFGERYRPFPGPQPPGTRHAAPSRDGISREACSRGTSNAAALASNAAGRLAEHLLGLGEEPTTRLPEDAIAPMLKAMLVHGSLPCQESQLLRDELHAFQAGRGNAKEQLSRFIGYGQPDIERVFRCTANRATLLGHGRITVKKADEETIHEFRMPLPTGLSGSRSLRKLTVTLGWISPVHSRARSYLRSRLELKLPSANDLNKQLGTHSGAFDHNQIGRGTVWHNVFEGKTARSFVEDSELVLRISCLKRGDVLDEEIPYGLVVSFECSDEIALYQEIRDRLAVRTAVPARVRA